MAQTREDQHAQVPAGTVPKSPSATPVFRFLAMGLAAITWARQATDQAAMEIVAKAMDHGVNFFDNAWEYPRRTQRGAIAVGSEGKT